MTIPWELRSTTFGNLVPRQEAWFHLDGLPYTYSGRTYLAQPWPIELLDIRDELENQGMLANSCMANLYEDGADSVGWHRDDEPGVGPTIYSLSFGAPRVFQMRLEGEIVSVLLKPGDLLIMPSQVEHRLPKDHSLLDRRINFTFRWTEGA